MTDVLRLHTTEFSLANRFDQCRTPSKGKAYDAAIGSAMPMLGFMGADANST
jgi:hypothetical protein